MTTHPPLTILALASEFKGVPFLQECKRQGCRVIVLVTDAYKNEAWPHEYIDEFFNMPDVRTQPDVTYAVSYLARDRKIDRIVALDDYDVETAAALREHMRLPGMGDTAARLFRDKLAMRTHARQKGILVPEFTGIFNYDQLRDFMHRVPAPWMLKPRTLAGSDGIRKLHHSEELWPILDQLGDKKSTFLLEQFIPGDIYHVDALTWKGEVIFSLVSKYGLPPMSAFHGHQIFTTRVLPRDDQDAVALRPLNQQLVKAMGREYGPTHTEFIKAADGRFYFLETAARVAGGNIDRVIEAATGLVIWRETAKMELADCWGEEYHLPTDLKEEFGALIACPSKVPYANTEAYNDPEIFFRPQMAKFAGLIVGSPSYNRVTELLADYSARFTADFMG